MSAVDSISSWIQTASDQLSACRNPDTGPTRPDLAASKLNVSDTNLRAHVNKLVKFSPRDYVHPQNLDRAAKYVSEKFQQAGGRVDVRSFDFHGTNYSNVVAQFGSTEKDAPVVVIGAHVDTYLGALGANDNGSGVAAMLEIARHAQELVEQHPNTRFEFVAFTLEECSYARKEGEPDLANSPPRDDHGAYCGNDFEDREGSRRHADELEKQGANVKGVIILETVGQYHEEPGTQEYPNDPPGTNWLMQRDFMCGSRGNFLSVLSDFESESLINTVNGAFESATSLDTRGTRGSRELFPDFFRADHDSYLKKGWKAVMLTDSANFRHRPGVDPVYHTVADTADQINFPMLGNVVKGVFQAVSDLAGTP